MMTALFATATQATADEENSPSCGTQEKRHIYAGILGAASALVCHVGVCQDVTPTCYALLPLPDGPTTCGVVF